MAVPGGLVQCPVCGEYRGTCVVDGWYYRGEQVEVTCVCEGIVCPRCGLHRMNRPISDCYDKERAAVLHVPYFMGWAGCKECRRARDAEHLGRVGEGRDDGDPTFLFPRHPA